MVGTREERQAMVGHMERFAALVPAHELNPNLFGPSIGVLADGPGNRIRAALRLADKHELTEAEQLEWDEACYLVFGNRMRSF